MTFLLLTFYYTPAFPRQLPPLETPALRAEAKEMSPKRVKGPVTGDSFPLPPIEPPKAAPGLLLYGCSLAWPVPPHHVDVELLPWSSTG